MKVAVGGDHRGFETKQQIKAMLAHLLYVTRHVFRHLFQDDIRHLDMEDDAEGREPDPLGGLREFLVGQGAGLQEQKVILHEGQSLLGLDVLRRDFRGVLQRQEVTERVPPSPFFGLLA